VYTAAQAAQTVAKDYCFHPVRSYLESVKWDGIERLERWLSTYLGVEDTSYSRAIGSRWLISAVARSYRPGVKADCCLILEGPQGIKKSTALKTLAGPYFTDELADLGSKDSALQTRGDWITLANFGSRQNLPAWRQSGLLLDSRRTARHQEIDSAEDAGRAILHG
jgi:predicted P-loop ATPase